MIISSLVEQIHDVSDIECHAIGETIFSIFQMKTTGQNFPTPTRIILDFRYFRYISSPSGRSNFFLRYWKFCVREYSRF